MMREFWIAQLTAQAERREVPPPERDEISPELKRIIAEIVESDDD